MPTKTGLLLAAALLYAPAANARVLDFEGNHCNGGAACTDNSVIDDDYGDVAGKLDVQYDSDGPVGGSGVPNLYWWSDYSGAPSVAWGDAAGSPSVFFAPAAGYQVTINGFDLSSYGNNTYASQYTIYDGLGNTLFSSGPIFVFAPGQNHFSVGLSSANGLGISFGPDGYNVGIDNIDFSLSGPGVPEPASWALMLGGFGIAGAALRRRAKRAASDPAIRPLPSEDTTPPVMKMNRAVGGWA